MKNNISKKQLCIYLKMIKIESNEVKEKFEIIDMNKDDLEFAEWVNDPEYLKFNTQEILKRIKKINRYIDYIYERI